MRVNVRGGRLLGDRLSWRRVSAHQGISVNEPIVVRQASKRREGGVGEHDTVAAGLAAVARWQQTDGKSRSCEDAGGAGAGVGG